ncbi:hypothetical protein B9G38_17650, partial [Halorubrum sp. SD612]
MRVTTQTVRDEHAWVRDRADVVVPILNDTRDRLGRIFGTDVDAAAPDAYRREVDAAFADGEVAVTVAACVAPLRDLDGAGASARLVVDAVLGRELA